jgi:SagB-type dehydrogenase family enzyme
VRQLWKLIRQANAPDGVWSLYHENSKSSRHAYDAPRSASEVKPWEKALNRKAFSNYKLIKLPRPNLLQNPLGEVLINRHSSRKITPYPLSLEMLSSILHAAYGVKSSLLPGISRHTVPSAGALYPLDIVIVLGQGNAIDQGLYVYVPSEHALAIIRSGEQLKQVSECMIESSLAQNSSALILITASFERTIFKYGERGYRFVLIESGHVAQNVQLVCSAMGMMSLPIGGFVDREMDKYLGLDGIQMSCIYGLQVGG